MTPTKNIPDKVHSSFSLFRQRLRRQLPQGGFFGLALVLVLLSALASTDFSAQERLFLAGTIATADVTADRDFLFEDSAATKIKREQAREMQPLVLDLVPSAAEKLRNDLFVWFTAINQADSPEEKEQMRQTLFKNLGEDLPQTIINTLADSRAQSAVTNILLPLMERELRDGVLQEIRLALPYKGGVIVRNLENGEERRYSDASSLPDLKSLDLLVSQAIKQLDLPPLEKRSLSHFLSKAPRASLIPNYESTTSRSIAVEATVQPVFHQVRRGEILIRQGERVTTEDEIKMQSLLGRTAPFDAVGFLGTAVCALLMSSGLLFAPSGKSVSPMENRDYVFLAVIVLVFSLAAKGISLLALQLAAASPSFAASSLAYAVPVTGAAGLTAMIFSARRYVVTGLLLSFFCTCMSPGGMGGIGLFLFYFLAYMWNTWLTNRTASRRDIVKSVLPLLAGIFALWIGSTCLQGAPYTRYLPELLSLIAHAVLSLLLTMALAPVIEMFFDYTTRFRLLELLNMEQPLLRDLMLNAPGTYHHSLITSNLVEAGAKAIGAHSLLCKVAALYHDIGKASKSAYFIENQTSEENPHNKLAPSMSALILTSHVKQGVELATQTRLGREVTDIIRQHHGTSLIRYFYQKALQQKDAAPPKEEDFRYPGPKPQSNEAGLVMLADIVEASARALAVPTPHRLRQHIATTIKNAYATGQLDETELTFRDLDKLIETFSSILRGIFHHRIVYPDADKSDPLKTAKSAETPTGPFSSWPPEPSGGPEKGTRPPAGFAPVTPYAYASGDASTGHPAQDEDRDKDAFPPVSSLPQ